VRAGPLGVTPSEGDIIAGRFRLVRELGRGAMGSVWLADHLTLEVQCAVKLIIGEAVGDPKYMAQFHVEARTIAQAQSPHVVRVLDHDVSGDVPYIAMELLRGEDLRERLHREGRLDPIATCRIVSQIARALAKAHAAGIMHRDLKPENVFIAKEDGEEIVKLLDFGVANWVGARLACSGGSAEDLIGTPQYMSPEHALGMGALDQRADLWALAVIAFECLTGRLPFEGATLSALFAHMATGAFKLPTEVVADLPLEVDAWWTCAASHRIDARFQSARDLAGALGVALGIDETGRSTNPPPSVRTPPPERLLSDPRDGSLRKRPWRPGYPITVATMVMALVLPFAAYGDGARSGGAVSRAHRVDEMTGSGPRTTPARLEVEALPSAPPSHAAGPPRRPSAAPAPRGAGGLAPGRAPPPSSRDDADGVLGI
jgi:serine/threonine protein kinase